MPAADDRVHLLAVDGNSLAHRAWHAILGTDDAVGHFVTAGILGMLGSVWHDGPFDGVVVAFDHVHNQRKQDWPEYKAHRTADPELREHIDGAAAHLADAGFHVLVERGAEGDDLLAATADTCVARGWRCTVLSSDRDLLALVHDQVTLLRPRATMADVGRYDPTAVRREYGVRPDQYTDLAALRGDPSDGLEGVAGIGPKMAARLLRDHEDLHGIYANLHFLPPRVEAALRRCRDLVERNRLLMSPLAHLEVDVDRAVGAGLDLGAVERALGALDLAGAAGRYRWALERPAAPPPVPLPDDRDAPPVGVVPEAVLARRVAEDAADAAEQSALW